MNYFEFYEVNNFVSLCSSSKKVLITKQMVAITFVFFIKLIQMKHDQDEKCFS